MDNTQVETNRLVELLMQVGQVRALSQDAKAAPFIIIPENSKVQTLEKFMPMPPRKTGIASFDDEASFARYVNEHKEPATRIFAAGRNSLGAILDFHSKEASAWSEHKAQYTLHFTDAWTKWAKMDGQWVTQAGFAEFMEDNAIDCCQPPGAELLEVARTLTGKTTVQFESGVRQHNGDHHLVYKETTQAKAGQRGELDIPAELALALPIYKGGEAQFVKARLKYRIGDGAISFRIEIVRKDELLDMAFNAVMAKAEADTGIKPFMGTFGK